MVGSDGLVVVAVGGPDTIASLLATAQAPFLHEAGDAIATVTTALTPQYRFNDSPEIVIETAKLIGNSPFPLGVGVLPRLDNR